MLLTSILLFVTTITGFTIPEGLGDGAFIISTNEAGIETITRIERSPNAIVSRTPVNSAKFVEGRQVAGTVNDITCANEPLNRTETKASVDELTFRCDLYPEFASTGPTQIFVLTGCTVAYYCNFIPTYLACSKSMVDAVLSGVTTKCGSYVSGWDRFKSSTVGAVDASIGYENYCSKGNNFCGVGTDGH